MNQSWEIRKAIDSDASDLNNCMQLAYSVYQERMMGDRLPPMDIDYALEIRDYPTWVVEKDKKIIGGLIMMFEDDHASLANIAIHPEFQGKGIGNALIRYAETISKDKNYTTIRLATHVLLTENISLYHHLGWKEYHRDDTRVYMEKHI